MAGRQRSTLSLSPEAWKTCAKLARTERFLPVSGSPNQRSFLPDGHLHLKAMPLRLRREPLHGKSITTEYTGTSSVAILISSASSLSVPHAPWPTSHDESGCVFQPAGGSCHDVWPEEATPQTSDGLASWSSLTDLGKHATNATRMRLRSFRVQGCNATAQEACSSP